jgi:hypothetical protein
MSEKTPTKRERVLDPIERSSEIVFGLIMVLTFTGSIAVASAEREEVREVLIGAIGCNVAWGLIDAVMYLVLLRVERGRGLAVARAVHDSSDAAGGRARIAEALPEGMDQLFDADALERARAKLVALPKVAERPRLRSEDWKGALGVFLLVFLSTFPVVVPFMFVTPLHTAMRVSNAVAIVMLYVTGHYLARHGGMRPVLTGLLMVLIGAVLVAITIALGG